MRERQRGQVRVAGHGEGLDAEALVQRVWRLAPQARSTWAGDGSHFLFVVDGDGVLRVDGAEHALDREAAAVVAPDEDFEVEAERGELELVWVRARAGAPTSDRVVRYADAEVHSAGIGREFRLLAGSTEATQFVGVVPPGRAPMHCHEYDELSYILEGDGVLHWEDGTSDRVGPGSCIHFPRLVLHSLENVGETPLRILGVFTPAGSPAARLTPEERPG